MRRNGLLIALAAIVAAIGFFVTLPVSGADYQATSQGQLTITVVVPPAPSVLKPTPTKTKGSIPGSLEATKPAEDPIATNESVVPAPAVTVEAAAPIAPQVVVPTSEPTLPIKVETEQPAAVVPDPVIEEVVTEELPAQEVPEVEVITGDSDAPKQEIPATAPIVTTPITEPIVPIVTLNETDRANVAAITAPENDETISIVETEDSQAVDQSLVTTADEKQVPDETQTHSYDRQKEVNDETLASTNP